MGDGARGTIKTIQEILARRQYPSSTGTGPRLAIQGSLNHPNYQGSILRPTIGTCPLTKESIPRTWLEIQYRYADGSVVPGASYVLQFDNGGAVAAFETNTLGRAHEIVPKGRTYRFRFEKDKTTFSIAPDHQCLAVVPIPVLSTWVDALLLAPTLAKGGLSWYSSKVIDQSDFLICPSFGKMAYLAILENTPFYKNNEAVPEVVTTEVADALAVVLKQFPGDDVEAWKAIAFNRLEVASGTDSRVIQSLLWQLHNHSSTNCRTLVDLLNSVGKGNAYRWIKNSLVAKLDDFAAGIVQNLDAVLTALDQAAGKIVQSTQSGVDVKNCAEALRLQLASVKENAAANIGQALATCFQRARALKKSDLEYWATGAQVEKCNTYLIRTKDLVTTEGLVKRLNHVGTGNAVDWLRDLAARLNTIIDDIAQDVAGILDDVETVLQSFKSATADLAKIETRHYANVLCTRFAPVKDDAENRVRKALQSITQQLATALKTKIEYSCPATLEFRNLFFQTADAIELRETSKVVWIDLQYCYADGSGISDATCVLSGVLKTVKPPKLDPNGFAHILVPPGKTGGFRFLKEPKNYELFPTYKCVANPTAALAGMVAPAITKIAGRSLQWDRCVATTQQKTFETTPSIGRILFNIVRGKTPFCIQEFERGTADTIHILLTCPQVNRDRWWTAAIFNHLVTLSEDGFLIAALLYKIHCYRRDNAGTNPPLSDLVRIMNTCGKGHAVKWLEARDFTGLCASVWSDLGLILSTFADQLESLNPSKQADTKSKLPPTAYQSVSELMKLARLLGGEAQAKVIAALQLLVNSIPLILNTAGVGADQPLTMMSCNLVRQEKLPPDTPVQPGEPWLAVRYRYADLKPIPGADVVLRLPGPADTADGALAAGFRLLNNPPLGAAQVYFRHESEFPGPRFFQADSAFESVASPPAPAPAGGLYNSADCDWAQFRTPKCIRFDWNEHRMGSLVDFQTAPSIGRLARNCVLRGTQRIGRIAGKFDEIGEMVDLLESLIEGGADGAENSLRLWCAVALNRVGARSGPAPFHENESRLRKAVLSRIESENVTLGTLMEMLNSAGKGRSVKWLRQLNADLITLRDAVAANITQILNHFEAEVQPITLWVDPAFTVPANRVHARIAPVRNQVVANMQLVFQKYVADLGALLPAILPRPYVYDVTPYCTNVLTQKKLAFPEAADDFRPPPAWHREPIIVRVGCDYADGTPVNTTFVVEQQNGPIWAEVGRGAAAGRWETNVLPTGGVFRFYVDHDSDLFTIFDKAKPWAQPYAPLPAAVFTTPQANLWAIDRDTLEWGDFTICDEPQFRASPTLGRILADCVITRVPFVSSPNDVQDICVMMADFIASPGTTNDPAMWARAGIQLLGTIQDVGSVIRGIILYSKDKEVRSAVWLLRRMNWAGKGSAVKWLKDNVLPGNPHIGVAQQCMRDILTDFRVCLANICAAGNVRKKLKDSLTPLSQNASSAEAEIDAKMPPALQQAVERIDGFLKSKDLPFYHLCGSGRTIYTQQAAGEFLESGNQTSWANKQALDQLAIANIAAANQRPMNIPGMQQLFSIGAVSQETLRRYLDTPPTRGAMARQMAPVLAAKSPAELRAFFANPGGDWTVTKSSSMVSLVHADGTLLRYKPDGDDYQKPPCATYCVEVKLHNATPESSGLQFTAFKVDPQGNAVPKHPGEVRNPVLAGPLGPNQAAVENHKAYYHDNLMKAGHRPIRDYKTV